MSDLILSVDKPGIPSPFHSGHGARGDEDEVVLSDAADNVEMIHYED
jgi:hypothetical protein